MLRLRRPVIGIMWVTFGHLRPSGHIMPDHQGDRGAALLVLAPHVASISSKCAHRSSLLSAHFKS